MRLLSQCKKWSVKVTYFTKNYRACISPCKIYFCVSVLSALLCLVSAKARGEQWIPGTGVTYVCEPLCGCWELNQGHSERPASALNLWATFWPPEFSPPWSFSHYKCTLQVYVECEYCGIQLTFLGQVSLAGSVDSSVLTKKSKWDWKWALMTVFINCYGGDRSQPWLHAWFKASLGCMRPFLKQVVVVL